MVGKITEGFLKREEDEGLSPESPNIKRSGRKGGTGKGYSDEVAREVEG